jgi:hypothetical protein
MNSTRDLIYMKTLTLSSQNNYTLQYKNEQIFDILFSLCNINSHLQRLFTMSNTDICASYLQGNEMYDDITVHNMGRKICGLHSSLILMRISRDLR